MLNWLVGILIAIGLLHPAKINAASKFQAMLLATPTSIVTPTPAATPTPTPEPLVGFCERLPILMYHHTETAAEVLADHHQSLNVEASWFDRQMAYLKTSGYNMLTITDVVNSLANKSHLPGKSVVVTADDGYEDIYENAYPVLQKYGAHMDLEIIAGLVGNPDYMTWDQLRQMQNSGLVHIYNHTWSHPALAAQKSDKVTYELSEAQTLLQQNLGITAKVITYPYGSYNNNVIAIAQGLGYSAGITTKPGQVQCDSFLMALHRTRIGNAPLLSYGL